MALHPDFPDSPYEIIDPSVRWLPDNQTLRDTDYGKLLPHLSARSATRWCFTMWHLLKSSRTSITPCQGGGHLWE